MRIFLLKILMNSMPLTLETHKKIEPIFNDWVDELNRVSWKPGKTY